MSQKRICEACGYTLCCCQCDKTSVSAVASNDGLDNREVFGLGLTVLWPHLKRATQLDVINRLREQPKAMLKPMQLQILEANLKTEQG